MKNKNLTNYLNKIVLTGLVLIFTAIFSGSINANPTKLTEEQKGLIGTWQLKRTGKSEQQKAVFIPSIFKPETLILAMDESTDEITINEGFKEFIQTQTLPTDGTAVTKNFYQIGKMTSKAVWQDRKLVVEAITSNGDKLIETFELSLNKKQLLVTLQLTKKNAAKPLKVSRVYNRVAEPQENETAQIGITVYPF